MLKTLIFFCGFIVSGLIAVHSLYFATGKELWFDEIYEVDRVESLTPTALWLKGAKDTPSASPLYFNAQKFFLKWILKKEKRNGEGFDWKVSLRVIPAVSLAVGAFLAFYLALQINWIFALALPAFLCCHNSTLYYGAETRIYATWLGLSLAFYVCSLLISLNPQHANNKRWWVLLAVILSLTCVSSLVVISLICGSILICYWVFEKKIRRSLLLLLLAGFIVSFLAAWFYKQGNSSVNISSVTFPTSDFVNNELFRILEGPKKALELFAMGAVLVFVGLKANFLRWKKIYFTVGLFNVSQFLALISLYVLQTSSGYFFAPRHSIFILGIYALTLATLVLLGLDTIDWIFTRFNNYPKLNYVSKGAFVVLCFLNWFNWRVTTIPTAFKEITASYKPYCHGPIELSDTTLSKSGNLLYAEKFIELNIKRHSRQCSKINSLNPKFYDFSPGWIYSE